jgi:hypothetical protein
VAHARCTGCAFRRAQTFSGGKIAKKKVLVSISTEGVAVKDSKVGKADVHFGPSALDQVKCKVGEGKRKNQLTVIASSPTQSSLLHVSVIHKPTFVSACSSHLHRLSVAADRPYGQDSGRRNKGGSEDICRDRRRTEEGPGVAIKIRRAARLTVQDGYHDYDRSAVLCDIIHRSARAALSCSGLLRARASKALDGIWVRPCVCPSGLARFQPFCVGVAAVPADQRARRRRWPGLGFVRENAVVVLSCFGLIFPGLFSTFRRPPLSCSIAFSAQHASPQAVAIDRTSELDESGH